MLNFAIRKKILIILMGLVFVVSCVSEKEIVKNETVYSEMPGWFLQNGKADSGIYFTAFSSRMRNRENEKENCLNILARQISKYYSVKAVFKVLEEKDVRGSHQIKYEDININENNLESIKENLTIIEEQVGSKGTYIKASISRKTNIPSFKSSNINGLPEWINTPPKLKGYIVSIGTARRHRMLNDSLEASDNNALAQMLKQINVKVKAGRKEKMTDLSTQSKEVNIEKASGTVNGFYVLERFIASDGNYYYSLAVSPEK